MNRLKKLREDTLACTHSAARVLIDPNESTKDLPFSLAEKKALSTKMLFDKMPVFIGDNELIVGTRTIFGRTDETGANNSCFDYLAMAPYVSDKDVEYFGFNHQYHTKAHYAPDYGIVIASGIDGLLAKIEAEKENYKVKDQFEFANAVSIAFLGLKTLIQRYATHANDLALKAEGARKAELTEIAQICTNISSKPAANIREAAQLFWFLYLGTIIENFQFINFGRIDQVLTPYIHDESEDELTEIMGCLLFKMYDQYDLVLKDKNLMGVYSAQHNITIGGIKRDGTDGSNFITKAILNALAYTRLPEPLVSIRVSKSSPDWLLDKSSQLSIDGMNCFAYYNDEAVVESLSLAGVPLEDARDYVFGLCQDILTQGRGDHYCSGGVHLTFVLLRTIEELKDSQCTYDEFYDHYMKNILTEIEENIAGYNLWENAILEYNKGNRDVFFDLMKEGKIDPSEPSLGLNAAQAAKTGQETEDVELYIQTLMSPLAITSACYHGCVESGTDITRCGGSGADKGFMLLSPALAINGLAAVKKVVFTDKRYSLAELNAALKDNWAGHEEMRQYMWNAPKWCNDDDFVDLEAARLIKTASQKVNQYTTPKGGRHLSGPHQPHPVFAGRHIPATPEGRFAGTPIPVTLSPQNGTLKDGPLGAIKSVAKIDSTDMHWNNCMMLQYFSSTFGSEGGVSKFKQILNTYFELGGTQHQPNIVDIDELKLAQQNPEQYKDLIIRMWGVSAHFVDLPRDVQDEFISRYEFA